MTETTYASTMPDTSSLEIFLAGEGWELLDPLPRDQGWLFRAHKAGSVVQAGTIAELCRRVWDIDRGVVRAPEQWKES